MDRREFIRRASMTAVFGVIGALGFLEAFSKLSEQAPPNALQIGAPPNSHQATSVQTGSAPGGGSQQPPAGYVYLAPLTALAGKTYAYFNHPTYGSSILLDYGGQWRAFSAICTHAGCTVDFTGSSIYCPCHGGSFSPSNGSVVSGPPPSPLAEYGVIAQAGALYVSRTRIN